jgi:flagella basal body P-ring formation protein FlgA
MKPGFANRCGFALVCALWGGGAVASSGAIEVALEQLLREQRPDVLRWQVNALSETAAAPKESGIAGVGRLGARTAVRFADGRVRWYAVVGMKPVLVSAHAVERGAEFNSDDAQLAERDVLALGCDPVNLVDASRRWRAARRLAAGVALCARDIEAVPEVERDQPVTLNARRGAVNASRVFTAASDAQHGERVRLRDRASGVVVVAIVTGPGAARLSEEQE